MIRLEEERRLLQSSNEWLARETGRLHEACTNQALLLWDRRQTLDSIQQGVFETLQGSDRSSNQMSELSRHTHEDAVRASIDSMQLTSPLDDDSWISQEDLPPICTFCRAARHVAQPVEFKALSARHAPRRAEQTVQPFSQRTVDQLLLMC